MRPSTSSLLRIRTIPSAQLDVHSVRLPASQRPRRAAKPTASNASPRPSTASSSSLSSETASPAQTRTQTSAPAQAQRRPQQTIAEQLLLKEQKARAAAAAESISSAGATSGASSWPSNLRVVKHVNKRELYWKVSLRKGSQRGALFWKRSAGQVELTYPACLYLRYPPLNETS
ncbi:hypothetical protein BCV69DRAFT_189099 [Microstroma glucosiphilum]|uniref:Uncharacterized protein n=1 Tax=Pseudomicrostroma glucosiphilum TaxID=1684307 RepID=A0A316U7K8_9BASI|nr:hypothetical protein BCV69DRAFT_189099 [Pseudomicrostroma glucosiphilum]PWN21172.1 hypothetical protein BCV69DRAFT_189099 [Pseudomicrostroma glucosiphilum]